MIAGRVWKFGDNINTDVMLPRPFMARPPEEQKLAVFAATRPGWVAEVRRGDIMVAGRNFGMGSSRPAARSLRNLGIGCLLAESINGLFFRNCVNFGFLAIVCPGVASAFDEGQAAEISLADFTVFNRETGVKLNGIPIPEPLLVVMQGGGLFPILEEKGLIDPMVPADSNLR
jgi:3-isopropylmalate/(R)-2-methylmalate dehydratase small subunit